jgi:hypothetical protein
MWLARGTRHHIRLHGHYQPCHPPLSWIHAIGQWGRHELGLLGEWVKLKFLVPFVLVDVFNDEHLVLYVDVIPHGFIFFPALPLVPLLT